MKEHILSHCIVVYSFFEDKGGRHDHNNNYPIPLYVLAPSPLRMPYGVSME